MARAVGAGAGGEGGSVHQTALARLGQAIRSQGSRIELPTSSGAACNAADDAFLGLRRGLRPQCFPSLGSGEGSPPDRRWKEPAAAPLGFSLLVFHDNSGPLQQFVRGDLGLTSMTVGWVLGFRSSVRTAFPGGQEGARGRRREAGVRSRRRPGDDLLAIRRLTVAGVMAVSSRNPNPERTMANPITPPWKCSPTSNPKPARLVTAPIWP